MRAAEMKKAKAIKKPGSFVRGAAVLSIGGIITKLCGAIYRIPLTNALGSAGMGMYQLVFPFYTLLLAASSAGIPSAISRLIAERLKMNDEKGAKKIFHTALAALSLAGLALSLAMYFTAENIAAFQGNIAAADSYRLIAPAIFLVSVISVIRGYFQGRLVMLPTALSQIVEQGVKIVFTLTVAVAFLPDVLKAVGFAVLGVTVSEAAALLFLILFFFHG
jgi:stage V sporulation protein B